MPERLCWAALVAVALIPVLLVSAGILVWAYLAGRAGSFPPADEGIGPRRTCDG